MPNTIDEWLSVVHVLVALAVLLFAAGRYFGKSERGKVPERRNGKERRALEADVDALRLELAHAVEMGKAHGCSSDAKIEALEVSSAKIVRPRLHALEGTTQALTGKDGELETRVARSERDIQKLFELAGGKRE